MLNIQENIIYMWLIRTNKITTKDYNKISRVFKKIGFFPRRLSPIIFVKALLYHKLQNKSWRAIWTLLNCNCIGLHWFCSKYKDNPEITKIFHAFAESRIIVFVGENKHFTNIELDNSETYLKLTLNELDNLF